MRSTRQLSVTLPHEMAEQVRARVAAGLYASESEVIREGLRALQARDAAIDDWLRGPVATAYDALKSDPTRARRFADVRSSLAAGRKAAKAPPR